MAPEPTPSSHQLPRTIGRYEVQREIGRGAMGRVLLALDPVLGREVAIKFLRGDLHLDEEERTTLSRRMRQEARASARVNHPNIVALHDLGETDELGVYLVFEYAEGITLKERLKRGPLAPEAVAQLAMELGDALTTAHRVGVLHRDIKPENIVLTKTGAKVADFGIARVPNSTLTKGGGLLGTPAYSSPESVVRGEHSSRSDQFSVAATLYEALSGKRAFPGDDAVAVASRIQTDTPPPFAKALNLDPTVDAVLGRGLAKDKNARYSSCAELGSALADSILAERSPSRPPQVTLPDRRHQVAELELGRARWVRVALGGVFIGALAAMLGTRVAEGLSTEAASADGVRRGPSVSHAVGPGAQRGPLDGDVVWVSESPGTSKTPRKAVASAPPRPTAAPPPSDDAARSTERGRGDRAP